MDNGLLEQNSFGNEVSFPTPYNREWEMPVKIGAAARLLSSGRVALSCNAKEWHKDRKALEAIPGPRAGRCLHPIAHQFQELLKPP